MTAGGKTKAVGTDESESLTEVENPVDSNQQKKSEYRKSKMERAKAREAALTKSKQEAAAAKKDDQTTTAKKDTVTPTPPEQSTESKNIPPEPTAKTTKKITTMSTAPKTAHKPAKVTYELASTQKESLRQSTLAEDSQTGIGSLYDKSPAATEPAVKAAYAKPTNTAAAKADLMQKSLTPGHSITPVSLQSPNDKRITAD